MNELKKFFFAVLFFASVLLTVNTAFAEDPATGGWFSFSNSNIGQDQDQMYNGSLSLSPSNGFTIHGGDQSQENQGYSVGQAGDVFANQYQEQSHLYSGVKGGIRNWTGQSGGSTMTSLMFGEAHADGEFSSSGSQVYGAWIGSANLGSGSAFSVMSDNFVQTMGGVSFGDANVSSFTSLSANNSYSQLATRGNDWTNHFGDSFTSSSLSGSSGQGDSYGGFVFGGQFGGSVTNQSNDGTFQNGSQFASANLGAGSSFDSGIGYEAEMGQTHYYQQYNQGRNGYQYQNGVIGTNVSVSVSEIYSSGGDI